jgi:ribA/ribD-fused uncharacterized protein
MHYSPFKIGNIRYCSVEQYLHAQKALHFKDYVAHQGIMEEPSARNYKNFRIENYDHQDWHRICKRHMLTALEEKFKQAPNAHEVLLSTGDADIVYATPFDRVLGTGLEITDDRNMSSNSWQGLNELGCVLMKIRESIRKGQGQ